MSPSRYCSVYCFVFFFQAEDGIRDHCVTGVQTCALPISRGAGRVHPARAGTGARRQNSESGEERELSFPRSPLSRRAERQGLLALFFVRRSEERRVGKECRARGWP